MNAIQKLQSLWHRDDAERELADELRYHPDMQIAQNVARGMSPGAPRRAALLAFGSVETVKEQCREAWPAHLLHELWQDVRYGLRSLGRVPGFTAVVVLTLALGIGANTAIFSAVRGVLLRPLPYADGDRLVVLRQKAPLAGRDDLGISPLEMADYRTRVRTLSGIAEQHQMWFTLLGRGEPERVSTGVVSADFFQVLGVRPLLGRTFVPADDRPGAVPVLVLSYEYWQRSHRGDPSIVGRTFEMNDKTHTVVGILPPVPQYPQASDVYMPTSACPSRSGKHARENRGMRMLNVLGRLRPGTTLAQAGAEMAAIAHQIEREHPGDYPPGQGFTTDVSALREELTRQARPTLLFLLGTVALVLSLVCANVANLTLARLAGRDRELAVRTALGAGRGRLVRQLLTESTLLALAGGVLGLLLAAGGLHLLVAFTARFTQRAGEIAIDGPVLLFTLVVALVTGLAFGSLPALSRHDPAEALKEGGERATGGAGGLRPRNLLIAVQLAVSFTLLLGAGLTLRRLFNLHQVDPGFHADNVLTAGLQLDWTRYKTEEKQRVFHRALLSRLRALPGVTAAAVASTFPLNEAQQPWNAEMRIEGSPLPANQAAPLIDLRVASSDYFATIGVPVVRGRAFSDRDDAGAPEVVVVNQSMARHYWGNADPVGRRISFDKGETWRTIVGVVGDVKQYGLDRAPSDEVYRPFLQFPLGGGSIVLRTTGRDAELERALRTAVYAIDPQTPVYGVQTLAEARTQSLASPRLTALLLALFAVVALAITAAGVAGLVAFSVSRRTHEIGIRMALGALPGEVLWMVLRQGALLVLVGLSLGAAGALALTRWMSGLLFEVGPADPLTFLAVALMLLAVAALASWVPARRATAIQPMVALRSC